MHKFFSYALLSAAFPGVAAAQTDEVVTLLSEGQQLVGTLTLPSGDPAPVVLLLHGFTGTRDELVIPSTEKGVFAHTAKSLADSGFASLRIDFRGSGESITDFQYEETTFEGQIADAVAAVDYLSSLETVAGDDIYVIGWSQGGLIASALAGRSEDLNGVALWQAVGDADATYGGLFGADILAAGKAASPDETITAALPWGAEVKLNGAFFDGIETLDPIAEIAAYSGPLFVTQGMQDTTVLPTAAAAFIEAHDGPEQIWAAQMDHVFNVFTEVNTLDNMIEATVAFFRAHPD